jgi:hypothetical protein
MIYVALTFHPNQKNPARESGYGVYRVVGRFTGSGRDKPIDLSVGGDRLILHADRAYKIGSRVDPLKIALAARRLTA